MKRLCSLLFILLIIISCNKEIIDPGTDNQDIDSLLTNNDTIFNQQLAIYPITENSYWSYIDSTYDYEYGTSSIDNRVFEIYGDTIIDNIQYKKTNAAFVRTDSTKAYSKTTHGELTFIDYSLSVGGTWSDTLYNFDFPDAPNVIRIFNFEIIAKEDTLNWLGNFYEDVLTVEVTDYFKDGSEYFSASTVTTKHYSKNIGFIGQYYSPAFFASYQYLYDYSIY